MTKEEFENEIRRKILFEDENLIEDFIDYWTSIPLNKKKMLFEYEQKFIIKRRFATWKKNSRAYKKTTAIEGTLNAFEKTLELLNREYGVNSK